MNARTSESSLRYEAAPASSASAPRRIGLVGAIASGKSLAARWFADRGWTVLDADKEAHALYAPGTGMCEVVVAEFGDAVRAADGGIDRARLGGIVFSDPARLNALEAIVHPALRDRLIRRIEDAAARDENIVLEMALLARWPEMVRRLDLVLGISAPVPLRLSRLRERNRLSEAEARLRLERQEPEEVLLSCATDVIVNDGTPEILVAALRERFPA